MSPRLHGDAQIDASSSPGGTNHPTPPERAEVDPEPHLQEVEAVEAAGGIILDALGQVLAVDHGAAALHGAEVDRGLLIAPVEEVDVRVVTGLRGLVRVFRSAGWGGGWDTKRQNKTKKPPGSGENGSGTILALPRSYCREREEGGSSGTAPRGCLVPKGGASHAKEGALGGSLRDRKENREDLKVKISKTRRARASPCPPPAATTPSTAPGADKAPPGRPRQPAPARAAGAKLLPAPPGSGRGSLPPPGAAAGGAGHL